MEELYIFHGDTYYYVRWANKVERVFTLKYFLEDIFRLFRTEIFDMYLM
jgi:hypothetical protein